MVKAPEETGRDGPPSGPAHAPWSEGEGRLAGRQRPRGAARLGSLAEDIQGVELASRYPQGNKNANTWLPKLKKLREAGTGGP